MSCVHARSNTRARACECAGTVRKKRIVLEGRRLIRAAVHELLVERKPRTLQTRPVWHAFRLHLPTNGPMLRWRVRALLRVSAWHGTVPRPPSLSLWNTSKKNINNNRSHMSRTRTRRTTTSRPTTTENHSKNTKENTLPPPPSLMPLESAIMKKSFDRGAQM